MAGWIGELSLKLNTKSHETKEVYIETVSGRRANIGKNKNKKLGGANQSFALFTNLAVENAILTSHESLLPL